MNAVARIVLRALFAVAVFAVLIASVCFCWFYFDSGDIPHFSELAELAPDSFGMYDLQINWGDGGLSCTGRVTYTPSNGVEIVWTEGHPFDAVPVLRLLQQTIDALTARRKRN